LPGKAGRRFDFHRFGSFRILGFRFLQLVNDNGYVAELNQVPGPHRPFARIEADAVETSPIRAAQITQAPAARRATNFGVKPADRRVLDSDFQRIETAHAQQFHRFPTLPFGRAGKAAHPDMAVHPASLHRSEWSGLSRPTDWSVKARAAKLAGPS